MEQHRRVAFWHPAGAGDSPNHRFILRRRVSSSRNECCYCKEKRKLLFIDVFIPAGRLSVGDRHPNWDRRRSRRWFSPSTLRYSVVLRAHPRCSIHLLRVVGRSGFCNRSPDAEREAAHVLSSWSLPGPAPLPLVRESLRE